MMNKIDVLGLWLDNYTVREAMMQVEKYIDDNQLHTIEAVTMQMLFVQENDSVVREVISSLDLTVISEKQILQVAGAETMQRVQETEANDFAFEFFRHMERNERSVYLVGENAKDLENVKGNLKEKFPGLVFAGEYALEDCGGDYEAVINDMNAMSPNVVVSMLPTPLQEHFLTEHREKMHTNIWYGMGQLKIQGKERSVADFFRSLLHWGRLKNSMDKYRRDEDVEE